MLIKNFLKLLRRKRADEMDSLHKFSLYKAGFDADSSGKRIAKYSINYDAKPILWIDKYECVIPPLNSIYWEGNVQAEWLYYSCKDMLLTYVEKDRLFQEPCETVVFYDNERLINRTSFGDLSKEIDSYKGLSFFRINTSYFSIWGDIPLKEGEKGLRVGLIAKQHLQKNFENVLYAYLRTPDVKNFYTEPDRQDLEEIISRNLDTFVKV
jgi:hypothetical protein